MKSELLNIFVSLLNEIENQFGHVVKILRSGNSKEYFSTSFSTLLNSHSILHLSTCPYAPQQNSIAERKNRHLVEIVRTLLLGANLPIHHRGDIILTTCYLINRMHYPSLDNKVPYSIEINLYVPFLLKFLVVLCMMCVEVGTNSQLELSNVS